MGHADIIADDEQRPNHIELSVKRENVVISCVACAKRVANLVNVQVALNGSTDRQVISAVS